jgi:HK97 family phage major capsid protein
MRENGVGEGAIAPVAEGALKSQFDLDLVEATVQVETIAGWMRVTRKAMNNIPGFASYLSARLPEKFQNVLDSQILYGDGTTPDIKGILTSGNFVASNSTLDTPLIEKLITDIGVLEDSYERNATGIVLRPIDYYNFFKNKSTGSGEYDLPMGVTFVGNQMFLFGIPVYASTAITSPDYIVGDWAMGAQLLTQEGMRIEFFEQDGTNVRENKVTVRIEGNYALPVYGPDYFIKGTTARA